MNLKTLAMATALVCAGAPAFAWSQTTTNTLTGNGQIVDPGGLGQQQGQRQRQTATGGASSATGGAGGTAAATIGGGAGAATIAPGAVNAGGNNVTTNAPPGFALPSFGGGQCGIVGFGVAISPSGGGAFGPAWESTNCGKREMAKMLASWGDVAAARSLLRTSFPEVEAAYQTASAPVSAPQPTAPPDSGQAIDLCAARPGWSKSQLAARYPAECHS